LGLVLSQYACAASSDTASNPGIGGSDASVDSATTSYDATSGAADQETPPGDAGAAGDVVVHDAGHAGGAEDAGDDAGDAGVASAAVPTNMYDGARTTTVSFDAGWKFHLGDVTGAQAPSFDDTSWTALSVPHDWSISLPFNQSSPAGSGGGYLDGGVGWYRKSFNLPASSQGQRVLIQFDGAYMDSTVWMNGTQICARPYGFISYECDFTSAAMFGGTNVLAVRLNNQQPSSRWYSGSGIQRHVWLKTVNPVRVAYTGTRVTTPTISSSSAAVNVTTTVQNDSGSAASVTLSSVVRDASGAQVAQGSASAVSVAAGSTSDIPQMLTVSNPKIWSLSSLTMYSVVTTVSVNGAVVDTYTTPFGIRSFAFDPNNGFSLNGQSVKLNGTCNHNDYGALGSIVNARAIQKRLEMLKSMGVNALRTSHNPPPPEFLTMADAMGFLVMDEAFDTWDQAKVQYDYHRFFSQWSTIDISAMVARDRNHPSVIIWSIGNEIGDPGNHTIAQSLISAVKQQDSTRAIGQAFANGSPDPGTAAMEDIVGDNYFPGNYDGQHSSNPSWKIFASETSSAVRSRGIYDIQTAATYPDNQCSSYDNQWPAWGNPAETSWQAVNSRSFVAGEFIWTGFDYIGEPTPYAWPSKSSYFGAIDTAGFPKDIFYFYQSHWNHDGPTMVHIVPMDWTSWTAGQQVPVWVNTNADSAELFLNGSSLGSKTVDPNPAHTNSAHLGWTVPFATGTLVAKATKNGAVVATDTVQTAGAPAALAVTADRTTIAADGNDLSYVEVDVQDSKGVLVPHASNMISFSVTGPGTIAGVDNGDAIDHESYKGNTRSAFSGKALVIIRSTTMPGKITLNASSGSLTAASVDITSQ
jgi:beta-galactosidase